MNRSILTVLHGLLLAVPAAAQTSPAVWTTPSAASRAYEGARIQSDDRGRRHWHSRRAPQRKRQYRAPRTDMDALPIEEATGLPYASRVVVKSDSGTSIPVMHACGHDIHMSSWMGTAKLMATNGGSLPVTPSRLLTRWISRSTAEAGTEGGPKAQWIQW